jgi:hypothetical protein
MFARLVFVVGKNDKASKANGLFLSLECLLRLTIHSSEPHFSAVDSVESGKMPVNHEIAFRVFPHFPARHTITSPSHDFPPTPFFWSAFLSACDCSRHSLFARALSRIPAMTDPFMVFPKMCTVLQEVFNLLPNRENFYSKPFSSLYHSSLAPPIVLCPWMFPSHHPFHVLECSLISSPEKAPSAMLSHLMDNLSSPAGLLLKFCYRSQRRGARKGLFRQDKRHDARDLHFITCVLRHPPTAPPRPVGTADAYSLSLVRSCALCMLFLVTWESGCEDAGHKGQPQPRHF